MSRRKPRELTSSMGGELARSVVETAHGLGRIGAERFGAGHSGRRPFRSRAFGHTVILLMSDVLGKK